MTFMKYLKKAVFVISSIVLLSCTQSGPKPIAKGDACDNCRMKIEDLGYTAEILTPKGKAYKFDDISCMTMFANSNADKVEKGKTYVADYPTGKLIPFENATFIKGGSIQSPMGGNTQAYANKAEAMKAKQKYGIK